MTAMHLSRNAGHRRFPSTSRSWKNLLGDTDFRELLDSTTLDEVETRLQFLEPDYHARHIDPVSTICS